MNRRTLPQLLLILISLVTARQSLAQENLPELVKRVKPAIVAIVTYDAKNAPLMTGSGFFLHPGQVVTNLHVIRGARRCEIKTLDGKGRVYPVAGLLDVDEEGDLALLSVEMPANRARSSALANLLPEEGEKIFVIGNPLKLEGSVSDGIVSAVRELPNIGKIIQITAPISHGNSGSPVFNLKGQVVGVVTIKVTNGQNINLAIGAARVRQLRAGKRRLLAELTTRDKSSDPAESLYKNGLDSLWLGNFDSALAFFENAVNRNPSRADAWVQVGYCRVKQGKNDEAIKAYQHAVLLLPESDEIRNKLGDAYYYSGRLMEAIAAYKEAVRLRPQSAEGYYNLALAYFENGNQHEGQNAARVLRQLDERLFLRLMSER
ncbi:MAG TPA: trypsin-like peptidase domain-containing protein [Pyrinomonadaceae bacterium]|nr:trypsin-like peptidase domain-containing protein [Pyrinomonadaceae bacterium]